MFHGHRHASMRCKVVKVGNKEHNEMRCKVVSIGGDKEEKIGGKLEEYNHSMLCKADKVCRAERRDYRS